MSVRQNACGNANKLNLLTTEQLAHYTGLSASFYEKRRSWKQDPSYIKIGGRVFYRQEDIDQWLLAQTCKPQESADV